MGGNEQLSIGLWFPRPERGSMLAKELRKLGHDVVIYHSQPVPHEFGYVRSVPYHWLKGLKVLLSTSHDVYFTSGFFIPATQLCINRLFTQKSYILTMGAPKWLIYNLDNKPIIFQKIMSLIGYPLLIKIIFNYAGAIVANSNFLSNGIKQYYPKYRHKVFTIYNGINYKQFPQKRINNTKITVGKIQFLSIVTTNYRRKTDGVILLLKAFEQISKEIDNTIFFIAAKCSNHHEINRVKEIIKTLSCSKLISIKTNIKDITTLLYEADIFLYATPNNSSDSLPRSIIEAQAVGIPTIVTDTVGCPEVVIDNVTGKVVPYSVEEIASTAAQMITNYKYAIKLANKGKEIVRKRFNWKSMAKSYEELFLTVIKKE